MNEQASIASSWAWRRVHLPIRESHARVGFGVYNVLNRDNYREVQNDLDSPASASCLTDLAAPSTANS